MKILSTALTALVGWKLFDDLDMISMTSAGANTEATTTATTTTTTTTTTEKNRILEDKGTTTTDSSSNTEGTQFLHFVAMNDTQTCVGDKHATPFNNQIRGVNLGGWMVLEPWITPSLFYQFLGQGEGHVAFDTYTFCEVLGPEEANKQLRRHWETWVTEDIVQQLVDSGAVNSLRLPIGDYMYKPYGPYGTSENNIKQNMPHFSYFPCPVCISVCCFCAVISPTFFFFRF